jgi:hypothetical protein
MCKKCKKAFRKDMTQFEESDEYCPHCDNHYVSKTQFHLDGVVDILQVIEAKEPQPVIGVEGEDVRVDARQVIRHKLIAFDRSYPLLACSRTTV